MMNAGLEDRPAEPVLIGGLGRHLNRQRFLFLSGDALGGILALSAEDISAFAAYWFRLTEDRHMGDGGRYRQRRYGALDARPGLARQLLPHGPYEQPSYINSLNGDVARLFDPLEPGFVTHKVLNRLLDWLTALYDQCEGSPQRWDIRLHPYRILASPDEPGLPTPEGLHRDGVDYIVSMMMSRCNVNGGETTLTDLERRVLWQRTLQKPLDILIGKDAQTLHAVSPVSPVDATQPARRDVLVIAFTKVDA